MEEIRKKFLEKNCCLKKDLVPQFSHFFQSNVPTTAPFWINII